MYYDDLVTALRKYSCPKYSDGCGMCPSFKDGCAIRTIQQAADAIEELSKRVDESIPKDDAEIIIAEVAKPRWIPVTERLPEAESGDISKPVLVTDGDCMAIAEWFNFEMCEPYWSYTGMGDITHWMPLPEPPKGE
jgi:hypothetical protein